VRGSQAAVSARLTDIQEAVRRAWASSLQFVGKLQDVVGTGSGFEIIHR